MLKVTAQSLWSSIGKRPTQTLEIPPGRLFGTDGIRGKVGELLTGPLARGIGFWTGKVLQEEGEAKGPVIIGQDSRNSSDMLTKAISLGLNEAGLDVWQVGLCPTPTVSYLTKNSEAMGGIMVSASHNPPEDNGIKFFGRDGLKISRSLAEKIENGLRGLITKETYLVSTGTSFQRQELTKTYLQAILQTLPPDTNFQGLRIVLDLAWGAAVNLVPAAFKQLGAEVICIHSLADGNRINVNCGSTHLQSLQEAVQAHKADCGFAFDGDADRVIAVDSQGKVLDGDYLLYIWGKYLQEQQKLPDNLIVATVMTNLAMEKAWQNLGGKLLRTSVGDQHVQAQMQSTGAMLGGEQSGHILCHHYHISGDGLQTALHLTAIAQKWGKSLQELRVNSFTPYPQLLRNIRVKNHQLLAHWQDCPEIKQAIAHASLSLGDGGRILVRASGTEPLIRVMVEACEPELVVHWTDYLVATIAKSLHFN